MLAKAPVAGHAKTRLGRVIGMEEAADLAAAALLDTLAACQEAFEDCHLALDGDLTAAARAAELVTAVGSWQVFEQSGSSLGERIAHAHVVASGPGQVVVQVGMDTPQITAGDLRAVAALVRTRDDAVLGVAADGGWWVLGLRRPAAVGAIASVETSTSRTGAETRRALRECGLTVHEAVTLRDVDTVEDAEAVAAEAPDTRFARAWRDLRVSA